ncbi:MAG TPA: hypothetical protein VGS10_06030 [Terracidiphilus sp.]|nr:hypothetical protein [Terracidiphilus sp.]
MKHLIRLTAALSVATLALAIPARSALAAAPPHSKPIPKLFDQVKQHAAEANYDAAVLDSYRRTNIDFRSYAQLLNHMKEHANDLFQDYYELQRVRDSGTPAQREAIDKLEPQLREMATELTNTFQKLNERQEQVNTPKFRDQVHGSSVKIHEVYKTLCECTGKNAKI